MKTIKWLTNLNMKMKTKSYEPCQADMYTLQSFINYS